MIKKRRRRKKCAHEKHLQLLGALVSPQGIPPLASTSSLSPNSTSSGTFSPGVISMMAASAVLMMGKRVKKIEQVRLISGEEQEDDKVVFTFHSL